MAPLSAGLASVLLVGLLAAAAKAGCTEIGVWNAVLILGFVAIHGVTQSEGIPLHPMAAMILSLGLASGLAGLANRRSNYLARLVRVTRPCLIGALGLVMIAAVLGHPSVAERRAMAGRAEPRFGMPRAVSLGLYGYERPTTPRLDHWAESGVVFERAFSTAPWTLLSHASMFTGRSGFETQTDFYRPLDKTFPTLAEVLAQNGYATAGFVANLMNTTEMSGLHRGFDPYEDFLVDLPQLLRSSWFSRTVVAPITSITGLFASERQNGGHVTAQFIRWLDQPRERPFFAFLNYLDAHEPYVSRELFQEMFGPRPTESWWTFAARWGSNPDSTYSEEQAAPWMNTYDGASWGEHGLIDHAGSLNLPQLHVPLFISYPGRLRENLRIGTGATLRDLPATVLDIIGLQESAIPGNSLTTLFTQSPPPAYGSVLLAELDVTSANVSQWAPVRRGNMQTLFEGDLHYIRNGDGVEELYDMSLDPQEIQDLGVADQQPTLNRLRALLDSVRRPAGGAAQGELRTGASVTPRGVR